MDADDTGTVELRELDGDAVAHLEDFGSTLNVFFDDLDTAWSCCLDTDNSGKVTFEEFQSCCRTLQHVGVALDGGASKREATS